MPSGYVDRHPLEVFILVKTSVSVLGSLEVNGVISSCKATVKDKYCSMENKTYLQKYNAYPWQMGLTWLT